jgi:hypothetical protein
MEWQDVAAALNRKPGMAFARDALRSANWFGEVGYSTEADVPAAEVEHDAAMWAHGVPPELIGRAGTMLVPPDVMYRHVKGPVHPYLRFEPGPIGGEQ